MLVHPSTEPVGQDWRYPCLNHHSYESFEYVRHRPIWGGSLQISSICTSYSSSHEETRWIEERLLDSTSACFLTQVVVTANDYFAIWLFAVVRSAKVIRQALISIQKVYSILTGHRRRSSLTPSVEQNKIHAIKVVIDEKLQLTAMTSRRGRVDEIYLKIEWDVSFMWLKLLIHYSAC